MITRILAVKIIILLTAIIGMLAFIVAIESQDRAEHQKFVDQVKKEGYEPLRRP